MSINVCPTAVVAAPVERVWELITEPARRDEWWDAHTVRVMPEGSAAAGQVVYLKSPTLGRQVDGTLRIEKVDPVKHQILWHLAGPLGIVVHQTTTCSALEAGSCYVQYG